MSSSTIDGKLIAAKKWKLAQETDSTRWKRLARDFELLAQDEDAELIWSFEASPHVIREHWSLANAPSERAERSLEALLVEGGSLLSTDRAARSMFPAKLLAEPSADRRWFSALRHARVNVLYSKPEAVRLDRGMVFNVAAASATLCLTVEKRSRRVRQTAHSVQLCKRQEPIALARSLG